MNHNQLSFVEDSLIHFHTLLRQMPIPSFEFKYFVFQLFCHLKEKAIHNFSLLFLTTTQDKPFILL